MQELEPLTRLSGVRFVALVTEDGVPIPVGTAMSRAGEADRLAAVSQQFLSELVQATAPLTWGAPQWARIASERGGLALLRVRGGALMLLYGPEADPAALKLPMQAAAQRVEKSLDRLGRAPSLEGPAPALPNTADSDGSPSVTDRVSGNARS